MDILSEFNWIFAAFIEIIFEHNWNYITIVIKNHSTNSSLTLSDDPAKEGSGFSNESMFNIYYCKNIYTKCAPHIQFLQKDRNFFISVIIWLRLKRFQQSVKNIFTLFFYNGHKFIYNILLCD